MSKKKPSAPKSTPEHHVRPQRFKITPRNISQERYIHSINSHELCFGLGPAGTGKTFLAVAAAVEHYLSGKVERIVLVRPAVEAGERLGFLPGSLQDKVDPYLRPLYDALYELLDFERVDRMIEIAPLAFMRGRTLKKSFVIMDEAQNTTEAQMKMFLTRLGSHSKAVVNGDLSQIDLPKGMKSGLSEAVRILEGVEGIAFETFADRDVVRHKLVQRIVKAYETNAANSE